MTLYLLFLIPLFAVAHGVTRKIDTHIVGGRFAKPGEVPYQVSLQRIRTERHFCGGVIVDQYHILTAAHCVVGVDVSTISANVGLIDLQEPHAVHMIESSYIHEDYNRTNSWINDIALLKLQSPIKYSSLVRPVTLTNQNFTAGTKAVVSGFGMLSFKGKRTTRLNVADIEITDQAYCRNVYASIGNIYDTQICANDPTIKMGSCQGDSGGPLTANGMLVGLVSWALGCADTIYPTVYTRTSSYFFWILKQIIKSPSL
ncbi:chymotrypsin-2-like [Temnothorax longispinosus]|uniref:chymotrypsin-2-like n=1 Tax=Temnothorax longispinosus TaxID=300112 RepID=UPI003A99DB23